tara:strand:- start:7213 stop:8142 length:930 start_codon:yes stop_codon:yes gene_type:complete
MTVNSIKYNLLIAIFFLTRMSMAQSDPKLSNYIYTPLTYNPAFANSYEGLSVSSAYSNQWLGFDGAPRTFFINVHGAFVGSNVGIGLDVVNDKIGATNETRILGNFAYKVKLNDDWVISMGVKSGVSNYAVNYNLLNIENLNENNLSSIELNSWNFNFGTGFYIYSEKFYLGFSIPNMLKSKYLNQFKNTIANSTPNYFFTTGFNFPLNQNLDFKPSLMTRIAKGAPASSIINLGMIYKNNLFGNFNFEPGTSFGLFSGFRVLEDFIIGYSYDISTNNFNNYNNGSHMLIVKYELNGILGNKDCSCYNF